MKLNLFLLLAIGLGIALPSKSMGDGASLFGPPTPSSAHYLGYLGPLYGNTSSTQTYSAERESLATFGAEGMLFRNNFGGGVRLQYTKGNSEGSSVVSVIPEVYWLSFEAKYRVAMKHFSPYLVLGNGVVSKKISTTILGNSETRTGYYYASDIGAGIVILLSDTVALDFAGRYYQYSNINGFSTIISVGYRLFASSTDPR